MITRTQYENAAQLYFKQNPKNFERYYSPTLLKVVVDEMQTSLPTTVAAGIALSRLIESGQLVRTDGKTETDDRLAAVTAARANLDQVLGEIDSAPLTPSELEYFGSLSQRELSRLFYGPDGDGICEFAVRYRKACKTFGFVLPPKFGEQAAAELGDIELTAAQYHALPAAELQRRLREPQFKAAVERLAQRNEI